MTVVAFPAPARAPRYSRPRLLWITRRARRLQRAYGIARRIAIYDAWRDYIDFTGEAEAAALHLVKGARHG